MKSPLPSAAPIVSAEPTQPPQPIPAAPAVSEEAPAKVGGRSCTRAVEQAAYEGCLRAQEGADAGEDEGEDEDDAIIDSSRDMSNGVDAAVVRPSRDAAPRGRRGGGGGL